MNEQELKSRFDFMIKTCKYIGDNIHLSGFRKNLKVEEKSCNNFVTQVDLDSDQYFINAVKENFPDDGYYSEERDADYCENGYTWIVDPLDGTHMYMNGFNHWCITSALMFRGELVAGCVYSAVVNDLYYAMKGSGAFLNGNMIRVRSCESLDKAFMLSLCSFRKHYDKYFPVFNKLVQNASRTRAMGCSLDIVAIAAGFADFYIGPNLSFYDIAGPKFIVEEAGGKVCNWAGDSIPLKLVSNTELICGSEKIVGKVLDLINTE